MAIADPMMAKILHVGINNPDQLSDLDAYRVSLLVRSFFNQYRRVHRLYQLGLLPESEWAGEAMEIASFMDTRGVQLFVEGNQLPEDFLYDVLQGKGELRDIDYTLGRGSLEIE